MSYIYLALRYISAKGRQRLIILGTCAFILKVFFNVQPLLFIVITVSSDGNRCTFNGMLYICVDPELL